MLLCAHYHGALMRGASTYCLPPRTAVVFVGGCAVLPLPHVAPSSRPAVWLSWGWNNLTETEKKRVVQVPLLEIEWSDPNRGVSGSRVELRKPRKPEEEINALEKKVEDLTSRLDVSNRAGVTLQYKLRLAIDTNERHIKEKAASRVAERTAKKTAKDALENLAAVTADRNVQAGEVLRLQARVAELTSDLASATDEVTDLKRLLVVTGEAAAAAEKAHAAAMRDADRRFIQVQADLVDALRTKKTD